MAFDAWMTDPKVLALVHKLYGRIDFDPASNLVAQEYVKAYEFCIEPNSPEIIDEGLDNNFPINCFYDGLKQKWHGKVFLNPPYSAGNIDAFVHKAIYEWDSNFKVTEMLMLVNSATDTKWYHDLLAFSNAALLWRGRIKFWKIFDGKAHEKWEGIKSKERGDNKVGNSPRYLNTLFYFNRDNNIAAFEEVFKDKGTIVIPRNYIT
jgi:hypothetical protein